MTFKWPKFYVTKEANNLQTHNPEKNGKLNVDRRIASKCGIYKLECLPCTVTLYKTIHTVNSSSSVFNDIRLVVNISFLIS
jgi:hypothetical protein